MGSAVLQLPKTGFQVDVFMGRWMTPGTRLVPSQVDPSRCHMARWAVSIGSPVELNPNPNDRKTRLGILCKFPGLFGRNEILPP